MKIEAAIISAASTALVEVNPAAIHDGHFSPDKNFRSPRSGIM
jgi:hypothetical protein